MRLVKYINELDNTTWKDKILSLINKNCKPFLKDINYYYPLYRGIGIYNEDTYFDEFDVKKDREPRNTDPAATEILNIGFKNIFGFNARTETIFCSGNKKLCESYGNLYIIFPIGNYEIVWSDKIEDLYISLHDDYLTQNDDKTAILFLYFLFNSDNMFSYTSHVTDKEKYIFKKYYDINIDEFSLPSDYMIVSELMKEKMTKSALTNLTNYFIKKYYKKGNLLNALKSNNEIMLKCKSYYVLNATDFGFDIWNSLLK